MHPPPGWVWSPTADEVDIVIDAAAPVPMVRDGEWWRPPDELVAGTGYAYRLDGDDAEIPDPRTRWQPDGVFGASRVDDPAPYPWRHDDVPAAPWARAVVYELHVGTFSEAGTFVGAADHLDHLVDLGITHVELMPVSAWSGVFGWGYDGVHWGAPHPAYGSPDDLRRLVDECHGRGLGVLVDAVYNHLGPEGAVLDRFGPYTAERSTGWGRAVNLDGPGSGEVRDFILGCVEMWLDDYHVDGLRLDAVHALVDRSPTHLVAEMVDRARSIEARTGRERVIVAEWDRHDPVPVVDRSDGGWGATAQWADDLHHSLHVRLTGESQGYYVDCAQNPDAVREALADVYVPRRATGDPSLETPVGDLDRSRFVVALQNHDQVGNRADGARIDALSSIDAQLAAATLVLLGPMVPLVFQGEEWASSSPFPFFADFHGELARSVSDGRREEFADHAWGDVLEPCSPDTFALARLDWSEPVTAPHDRVVGHYRTLLRLRAANPDLWAGAPCDVRPARFVGDPVVELSRGRFVVTVNLSDRPAHTEDGEPLLPWAASVVQRP